MRPPHAVPVQPVVPDERDGESLALALIGLAGVVLVFLLAFVLLPLLGVGVP